MYEAVKWQSLNQLLEDLLDQSLKSADLVRWVLQLAQELELEHSFTSNLNSHIRSQEISLTNLNEELV